MPKFLTKICTAHGTLPFGLLENSPNTSVFFENWNSNTNWYTGFPATISASHAREEVYSVRINWNSENIVIKRNLTVYPNNDIISGHLVGDQTATWTLKNYLLGQ